MISPSEEPELDWVDDVSVDEPVPVGNLQVYDSSAPVPKQRQRILTENQFMPDLAGQPPGYADIAAVELMQLLPLFSKFSDCMCYVGYIVKRLITVNKL